MKKFLLMCFSFGFALSVWAQDRVVTGTVTSKEDGSPLPGVNVVFKGTTNGTATDANGKYSLSVSGAGTLIFSFIGLKSEEVEIGERTVIDLQMTQDVTQLSEVVVTALGETRQAKTLSYAAQPITAKNLNITNGIDVKNAIGGKVAGVQIVGQAGSKLGEFGKIRVRGASSLTSDNDPLYVVDGIPVADPNDVDMNNVESVNVLKGPAATAAYGQRADAGVIMITTKKGIADQFSVEFQNTTTFDKVSYLPKYQNKYGGGYAGDAAFGPFDYNAAAGAGYEPDWAASGLQGQRYLYLGDDNYADESWGPKFDGQDYIPWYAWWKGNAAHPNPYFGKTAKYVAQPNNVKNFFDVGVTRKSSIALSGGGKNYTGRVAYTHVDQGGIIPFTSLKKDFIQTNFDFHLTDKLTVSTNLRYTTSTIVGNFDDGYANQVTGSFNQWFNRNVDTGIEKQLIDLTTPDGYSASWNWWGPDYYTNGGSYHKPAFWFNHYTYARDYKIETHNQNYTGGMTASYKITNKLTASGTIMRSQTEYARDWKFPFFLANSAAPDLYNAAINSFGVYRRSEHENNFSATLNYKDKFADGLFDLDATVYGNIRQNGYDRFSAEMNPGAKTGGLIIPDLYSFANAGQAPTASRFYWNKQVNSMYARASIGYKGLAYLDLGYRKDYSSALPKNKNGYGYPSVGANFILSEVVKIPFVSYAKVRANWAQVGNDIGALALSPLNPIASKPFNPKHTGNGTIVMNTPSTIVDPNIVPALNSAYEGGIDLKFFENRAALSVTAYTETRKNEIVTLSIPSESGYNFLLTNGGEAQRHGIEISLSGDVLKMENGFTWNSMINFSTYNVKINSLPQGLQQIANPNGISDWNFVQTINPLNGQWGTLRGRAILRDSKGNKVVDDNGYYKVEANHDFGSVVPKFNGGFINTFSFKGVTLLASIQFQKGGKFMSESEMWMDYTGLAERTAGINDRGKENRAALADGGGVHVVAVKSDGSAYNDYVDASSDAVYWSQFNTSVIAEPYIHSASYMKLSDVSISYDLTRVLKLKFVKGFQIGAVGRNLARFGLAKDNFNKWDPSELANSWGESGQLPGTKSYGFNVKVTF